MWLRIDFDFESLGLFTIPAQIIVCLSFVLSGNRVISSACSRMSRMLQLRGLFFSPGRPDFLFNLLVILDLMSIPSGTLIETLVPLFLRFLHSETAQKY